MKKIFIVMMLTTASILTAFGQMGISWSVLIDACTPATINFTIERGQLNNADSCIWVWGDGNSNKQLSPLLTTYSHLYSSDGKFPVMLTVYYNNNTSAVAYDTVTIYPMPQLSLSHATLGSGIDTICPGGSVSFTSSVTVPANPDIPLKYRWDFGDGGIDTTSGASASHTFANPQNIPLDRDITLVVNYHGCEGMATRNKFVHIRQRPAAGFTVDNISGCYRVGETPSHTFYFTDTSFSPTATGNTYLWTLSDGQTSTSRNPSFTMTVTSGTEQYWAVTLQVTDANGCVHSVTKNNYISVKEVSAAPAFSDTIICKLNTSVEFSSPNKNPALWNFRWVVYNPAGGLQADLPESRTSTRLYVAGDYEVMYILSTRDGMCSDTAWQTIHVYDTVKAQVSILDTNWCEYDKPIYFNDTTPYKTTDDFGFHQIIWQWNDNANQRDTTTGATSFAYGVEGEYYPSIRIRTPYGCLLEPITRGVHLFALRAVGVVIDPAPPAPASGCLPFQITVGNNPDSLITTSPIVDFTWYWDITGDTAHHTSTGTTDMATHVYRDTGHFWIYMQLTNAQGCVDTFPIKDVWVGYKPYYDFSWRDVEELCKSQSSIQTYAYSLIKDTNILDPTTGRHRVLWRQDSIKYYGDTIYPAGSTVYLLGDTVVAYPTFSPNNWDRAIPVTQDTLVRVPLMVEKCDATHELTPRRKGSLYSDTNSFVPRDTAIRYYDYTNKDPLRTVPDYERGGYTYVPSLSYADDCPYCKARHGYNNDTLWWSKASDIAWLNPLAMYNPFGGAGSSDTATISPSDPGKIPIAMQPSHNGCAGDMVEYQWTMSVCPPVAGIKSPAPIPPYPVIYACGMPVIGKDTGTYYPHWPEPYTAIGAATSGGKMETKHVWIWDDSAKVVLNPLNPTDTIWDNHISDTILNYITINDTIYNLSDTSHINYEIGKYASHLKDYPGVIYLQIKSINDDTNVCAYVLNDAGEYEFTENPNYNPCGYCEDDANQPIAVSVHIPNFMTFPTLDSTVLPEKVVEVCENDTIFFVDSSWCNFGIADWIMVPSPTVNTVMSVWNDDIVPLLDENGYFDFQPDIRFPRIKPQQGYTVHFSKTNEYKFYFVDINVFPIPCQYIDSIIVKVRPRSVPAYTTYMHSSPSYEFNTKRDTLCANTPDSLWIREQGSFTPAPYTSTQIVKWYFELIDAQDYLRDTATIYNKLGMKAMYTPYGNMYDIKVMCTNEFGCDSTVTDYERVLVDQIQAVYEQIEASFVGTAKTYCSGADVGFINKSKILPASYYSTGWVKTTWMWGDGTPNTVPAVLANNRTPNVANSGISHQFHCRAGKERDTFYVTIRVEGLNGLGQSINCMEEYTDTVIVQRPVAQFLADAHNFPCAGKGGQSVRFSDISSGDIDLRVWQFGDSLSNAPAYDSVVYHNYKSAGSYDVILSVTDRLGCSDHDTVKGYVFIGGPLGTWTSDTLSGCIPLQVTFTPQGVSNIDSVIFQRGDGTSISLGPLAGKYNPQKWTYRTGQVYYPYFQLYKMEKDTAGNYYSCIIDYMADTIYAIDLQPNFTFDSLYCPDMPIDFVNTTVLIPAFDTIYKPYYIDSIRWDYGNGEIDSTEVDSALRVFPDGRTMYTIPGKYAITLYEKVMSCYASTTHEMEVIEIPQLGFLPDSAAACDGLDIIFYPDSATLTAKDRDHILSYLWFFEDISDTLMGEEVLRQFDKTADYPFKVSVYFVPTGCVIDYYDTVIVNAYTSPTADFEPDKTEAVVGESIQFTDKSTIVDGQLVKWNWTFGDGDSVSTQNPTHAYNTTSGYVTVILEIIDEYGCKNSVEKQILITEMLGFPNVFTPQATNPATGLPYTFKPSEEKGFFKEFKFEVYDRWGMLVWKQNCTDPNCPEYQNPNFWWDGKNRQGNYVSDGVYFWVIYAIPMSESNTVIQNGSVTVTSKK
ncbi:MAG: PKD domain-containing protein [Bacteroidales bacterium]|jgi:PKD repeat protein|nr:PKD domain-containing protein [Bacteroidales bacterium]